MRSLCIALVAVASGCGSDLAGGDDVLAEQAQGLKSTTVGDTTTINRCFDGTNDGFLNNEALPAGTRHTYVMTVCAGSFVKVNIGQQAQGPLPSALSLRPPTGAAISGTLGTDGLISAQGALQTGDWTAVVTGPASGSASFYIEFHTSNKR